jgi:hypothetical protein
MMSICIVGALTVGHERVQKILFATLLGVGVVPALLLAVTAFIYMWVAL